MSARRTTRPLSTALAAAVLAGGLAATAAAPALAAPAETTDGCQNGHFVGGTFGSTELSPRTGRFYTQHAVKDVRVTVAPFYPAFTDLEEISYEVPGEMGPETDVEFTYDAELEAGYVDVLEQRRVLDEEGTAGAVFTLYVDGKATATLVFGEDRNLGDDVPGMFLDARGPQTCEFGARPTVDHQTHLAAPGSRLVHLQGNSSGDAPGVATLTVTEQPEHGTLVELPRIGDPTVWTPGEERGSFASTVYVADEGFTGTDQAVFTITDETTGEEKTLVVTFSIGDPRAADPHLGVQGTGLPFDEARVWEALEAQGEDDESEAPAPESPATPAPDSTDAPEASEPSEPADEHTVPETVETGSGQAWWLAAVAAVGTGALVAGRRRFGLAR
ncbi:hypothetical protein AB0J61_08795 [Micrococcus luteus]|uniref:hypothetical protein n=1 Tax=Micrococcus luteus TaxID=1270 RepID=UPI00342821EE